MKDKPIVLQTYHKDAAYSYASGAYATFELLRAKPELARAVHIHSKYTEHEELTALCRANGVPVLFGDRCFARVNQKENAYVLGVFEKEEQTLDSERPHALLVNPGDMGNLGTMIRAAVGLGLRDLGIVTPACDLFHPKTVRASMGALFRINISRFASFDAYRAAHGGRYHYPFMLNGADIRQVPIRSPFTLIFGNEATGLDPTFMAVGESVRIPQSDGVDSYNIAVAFGIGVFMFMNQS